MNDIKYFKLSEFDCKCGCEKNNVDIELMEMLDEARGIANTPFVINSGCRCIDHNKKVGGKSTSSHLHGLAVDIKVRNSKQRAKILSALIEVGFARIGIAEAFIHVDIDKNKAQNVFWVY